jgi:hypothetical protein
MSELVFEWDEEKERKNIRDHGVYFIDAAKAFYDYFRIERWQTMGFYEDVLFVVYTERRDAIRISRLGSPSLLSGGYIMAIVRYTAGRELTPEVDAEAKARIRAVAQRLYTYDPDCPLMTEKQLSEFRPVNFDSMEERAAAIKQGAAILEAATK